MLDYTERDSGKCVVQLQAPDTVWSAPIDISSLTTAGTVVEMEEDGKQGGRGEQEAALSSPTRKEGEEGQGTPAKPAAKGSYFRVRLERMRL